MPRPPRARRALWPERLRRSTSATVASTGSCPTACTASVCTRTGRSSEGTAARTAARTAATISAIRCTVPISPFAHPTLTSAVSGSSAATTASGVTLPSRSGRSHVARAPRRTSPSTDDTTEACSIGVVITCAPDRTGPAHGQVVRLRAATGEHDLSGRDDYKAGNVFARLLDGGARASSSGVEARRVAARRPKPLRQHGSDLGAHTAPGVVVQVHLPTSLADVGRSAPWRNPRHSRPSSPSGGRPPALPAARSGSSSW